VNIQNVPRDDKVVKAAFRPRLDALLFYDYPSIENKLLGFYLDTLGHPSMAEAFREGLDPHILTAAGVYGRQYDDLLSAYEAGDKEADLMRQTGKRLNYSIIFGGGIPTLVAQGVAKDSKEALDLLRKYHGTWPGIGWASKNRKANEGTLAYHIDKRLQARGYITTLWGRHLHPHSGHVAINALCQGCAADLMKWALIQVHRYLKAHKFQSHLVLSVHDELTLDSVEDEIPTLVKVVPDLMTFAPVEAVVPIRPEPDISWTTWADKTPYKETA
jgi:DNA polymerase-1